MMTRRALSDSALAISTSCICASDSDGDRRVRREIGAELLRAAAGPPVAARRSSISRNGPPFSGSRPMKMLAATVRLSNRFSSWCTKAMPPRIEPPTVSRGISDAVELDRAGARRDHAAEDLHQRRFAGAVLADEADHFARADGKADVVQRLDAGIHLRDSRHLQERIGHRPNYAGWVRQDCKTRRTGRLGDNAGLLAPRRQPPMRDFSSASNASTLALSMILVGTMISLFSGTTDLSPSRYFAISFMPW